MFWRFLTALIVLFWAVMTGLIIRDTYFPDHSRFAKVPVRMVFDLFLSEAAAFNNTLQLYHGQEKIGHTSFAIRNISKDEEEPLYGLLANGSIRIEGAAEPMNVTYAMSGEVLEAEKWQSFKLEIKAPSAQTEAHITWRIGDELPELEVRKSGQVMMNTQMAKTMLNMTSNNSDAPPWLAQLLPTGVLPSAAALQLTAREGLLDLAGKRRRCYVVTLALLKGYEMRMYFTELGELARIELPQDYRLIEPMMHGLEPGMKSIP
jgi:hypothetical protein